MKRRGLFRLLAGATAAAAMEVCGLLPVRKAEVVFNPVDYMGEMHWVNITLERTLPTCPGWGSLLEKAYFPSGMGNNVKGIKS